MPRRVYAEGSGRQGNLRSLPVPDAGSPVVREAARLKRERFRRLYGEKKLRV